MPVEVKHEGAWSACMGRGRDSRAECCGKALRDARAHAVFEETDQLLTQDVEGPVLLDLLEDCFGLNRRRLRHLHEHAMKLAHTGR